MTLGLYESLLNEERRDEFVASVLDMVGGSGATWFSTGHTLSSKSFFGFIGHDFDVNAYMGHYFPIDVWHQSTKSHDAGTVMLLSEDYNRRHFGQTEFFNDFCLPQIKAASILCGNIDPATNSHLSVYREAGDRPFSVEESRLMTALIPHLENWRRLHCRIGAIENDLLEKKALLDSVPIGVALVTEDRRLIEANAGMIDLFQSGDGLQAIGNIVCCPNSSLSVRLEALIASSCAATTGDNGSSGGTLSVPLENGACLDLEVMPWVPQSVLGSSRGMALLTATRSGNAASAAPIDLILCDLTSAEREVGRLLIEGLETDEIAQHRGTSIATTRTQIKAVLAKADCRNRSELVRKALRGDKLAGTTER